MDIIFDCQHFCCLAEHCVGMYLRKDGFRGATSDATAAATVGDAGGDDDGAGATITCL
jgi:hypothetical protein